MAVLFSATSQNWTAAGWKTVDATSYLNNEGASTATTTSYVASSTFAPGAITVEGILLKISFASSVGTFSVQLYNSTGAAAVATVTVATSELKNQSSVTAGGWCYFKFAAPVVLLAATNYSVRILSSTSGTVTVYRDGTAGNWSRGLVTSTAAALANGDSAIICGDLTTGSTGTTTTITYDYTGANSYPLIEIGNYGKVICENAASKNYALTISSSGFLRIAMNGIFEIGNSSTRLDATSTFIITLTSASSGVTYIEVRNGVFRMYGASKTRKALLAANASAGATTLTTDVSTSWKNGDNIGIAGTGGITQQMFATLNADAVGTSLSLSAGIANATEGTAPVQADIINLTSNVKIQGTSNTLTGYTIARVTSTYDVDQVEFRYMGNAAATPAILVQTNGSFSFVISGSLNIKDCAFHSASTGSNTCRYITDNTSIYSGITIDGCVFHFVTATAVHINLYNQMGWGGQTSYIKNCVAMGGTGGFGVNSHQYVALDSNTFANINGVAVIGYGYQVTILGATNPSPTLGTNFSNIKAYRCVTGFQIVSANLGYVFCDSIISNCTFYRNTNGIYSSGLGTRLLFDSCTLFGNTSYGVYLQLLTDSKFLNCSFQGGTGVVSPMAISGQGANSGVIFNNCNFGTVTQHSTADVVIQHPASDLLFINCNFGSTTLISNQIANVDPFCTRIQRLNGSAGVHRTYKGLGTLSSDTTIFDSSPSSQRLTPRSAGYKLKSSTFQIAVANGQTATFSIKVRKSVVGDGTAYNGNQPRLILLSNPSAGSTYNSDIVCATATNAANGAWETLSYTLPVAVTDNVGMQFYVDCDGTTGWVNIDTITVS